MPRKDKEINLTYRKATADDITELAKIRSMFLFEIGNIKTEKEFMENEIANQSYFKVAIKEDSFIAWLCLNEEKIVATSGISFSHIPPSSKCLNSKMAYISSMFTIPEYRKLGIATELVKKIIEEAKKRECTKITLNATEQGRSIYERYEFQTALNEMVLLV